MSREQYQIPTSGSPSVGGTGGSFNTSMAARDYDSGGVMYYMCGDCAVRVPLEKGAPIRCQKCGARVLYKERTKRYAPLGSNAWMGLVVGGVLTCACRMVQFEAR
jgi:DNA-directed RNA polymerase I, II, and III subunit RPABC4